MSRVTPPFLVEAGGVMTNSCEGRVTAGGAFYASGAPPVGSSIPSKGQKHATDIQKK